MNILSSYRYHIFFLLSFVSFKLVALAPFVVISPTKCGTHLVGDALGLILDREPGYHLGNLDSVQSAVNLAADELNSGRFLIAHNFTSKIVKKLVSQNYKVILMIRDPRDQIISIQSWLREGQWPWFEVGRIQNMDEQLTELITGNRYKWHCIEKSLLKYIDMTTGVPNGKLYIVQFENLVGPLGGGSFDKQVQEMIGLAAFLEAPLTTDEAGEIANQIFGRPGTFRHGQIGVWKSRFSAEHKKLFKSRYKKDLIKLGYEKDSNW